MAERTLEVTSRLGLHARAAANLVRVAERFRSKLTLRRPEGGPEADAKSILDILTLAASYGTRLKLVAIGDDENEALEAIVGLFSRAFDENERVESAPSAVVRQELHCKGLGVSDGVVTGRVLRLHKGSSAAPPQFTATIQLFQNSKACRPNRKVPMPQASMKRNGIAALSRMKGDSPLFLFDILTCLVPTKILRLNMRRLFRHLLRKHQRINRLLFSEMVSRLATSFM